WLHGNARDSQAGERFDLTAREPGLQIAGVSPNHGTWVVDPLLLPLEFNFSPVTLTIHGTQLSPATTVSLVGPDGSRHAADRVLFQDGTTVYATFDMKGLAVGAYDVRVDDGGRTATAAHAFTVDPYNYDPWDAYY